MVMYDGFTKLFHFHNSLLHFFWFIGDGHPQYEDCDTQFRASRTFETSDSERQRAISEGILYNLSFRWWT